MLVLTHQTLVVSNPEPFQGWLGELSELMEKANYAG